MSSTLTGIILAVLLFFGLLCGIELGRKAGTRWLAVNAQMGREGLNTIETAMFALMGLMIAFTFSGAAGRLDNRRSQIGIEANAIGTAWLRLNLLPPATQDPLRQQFREYTDARMTLFQSIGNQTAMTNELAHLSDLQNKIWASATSACQESTSPAVQMLVLPPINEMFDMATLRNVTARIHPPPIVFVMLVVLMLLCCFLAGYAMGGGRIRNHSHIIVFVVMLASVFYVTFDLEYPRIGLIRIDAADEVMINLRQSMH